MSGIVKQLPEDLREVDVIIAGGGTAACIIASRLSDADPNLSVLVIEGGKSNLNDPSIVLPVLCLGNLLPTSTNTLFYQGVKEPNIGDRQVFVQSGGTLGGGSAMNLTTYSRPQKSDLDAWNTPGWSADELVPHLKKFETYHGQGTPETHGDSGPIHVSESTFSIPHFQEDFIRVAKEVGYPEAKDINDLVTGNAVQRTLRYIGLDGKRQDAAHRYLQPRLLDGAHPNLHVLVENQVGQVLFEGKRAVGVEYKPNPRYQEGDATTRSVKARRLVIVSSSALGSPLILERSGLGDPEILIRAGVDVVADLPGVGSNYTDHHLHLHPYKSSLGPEETLDALFTGRRDLGEVIGSNDPILGWNASDVTSKLRPSDEAVAALGPEFQAAWDRDYKNDPSRPGGIITILNGFPGDPNSAPTGQYIATSTFTTYPFSRGHIHITGREISDPYEFCTGLLSDPENLDIKMCSWAYKTQREMMRRLKAYRGEYAPGHPPFPAHSAAACGDAAGPLTDVKDIVYSEEDDAILDQWLRETVGSTWHSLGTCKMAPREEGGVVDASLSVYGVEGLKVADMGIAPGNVGANTNSTALLIGEKAAEIFIKELGL